MANADQQARLEEAFERIEETILPCIAMMLETLLDASASLTAIAATPRWWRMPNVIGDTCGVCSASHSVCGASLGTGTI